MSQPLLEVKGIDCFYGNIQALHGVSLTLNQGEVLTLLGANGAGKTTILRAITGLVRPRNGEILFAGEPIHRTPAHQLVERGLAMAPEGRQVFPRMTVMENLEMGAFVHKQPDPEQLEWVLELFPRLRERLRQSAGTLSGGEQQMLAIGRALMSRPKLLLLDEPSLGLAPLIIQQIFAIITEIYSRGVSVLLVEQNAFQALKIGQRAYVLETGKVTLEGPAAELAENPRVREAYLGL
ncbi:MAG: ABC transporter ATP-binding protein [Vulcanimicrobiota bacterium]